MLGYDDFCVGDGGGVNVKTGYFDATPHATISSYSKEMPYFSNCNNKTFFDSSY